MDRWRMPGPGPGPERSVVSVLVLILLLHGLLCLQQLVALAETTTIELDEDVVMEDGSCMHFSVSPPPAPPEDAEERRDYFRAMVAKDRFRHEQMIAMRGGGGGDGNSSSSRRREAKESSKLPEVMSATSMFELPMRSAVHIANVGMYLVSVRFGTPALPYNLVLATANDLTWINCRLRRRKGKHYGRQSMAGQTMSLDADGGAAAAAAAKRKNWYRPFKSSSWRRMRCSQKECAVLLYNTCQSPSKMESCSYHQKTQDGTVTIGIYGKEKATVTVSSERRMAKLPGLILGCSLLEAGGSVDAHDGVLSLGNGDMSFAVHAAKRFGNRFSFCLLSANSSRDASSYLTFGPNPAVMGPATMETDMIYNADVAPAFGPRVTAVLVAGERLDIPDDVWNTEKAVGAGVILDTSTSVTALVPEAYGPITAALHRHLSHLPRAEIIGFDYCYRWTYTGDGVDPAHNVTIPRLTVEMAGGARLEPEPSGVVMPEVGPGVACLAFTRLPWGKGPGIFGNVLMQEYIWEIDHGHSKIRFKKDKCNTHHLNTTAARKATKNGSSSSNSSSSTVLQRVN